MPPAEPWDLTLIHDAVARQAGLRPAATAIVHGGEQVDYRRLDTAAEAYAHWFAELGAEPGQVVPVVLPRTAQLIAVLLGVLKTGAAYAALDRRWPAPRLAAVVAALRPRLVVADSAYPGLGDRVWIVPPQWPPASGELPRSAVDGASPAAVFFTSGSTGAPKAVISPHRGTTRLFPADYARFGPATVMAQTAPVAWDGFSLEVWGPLTTGGTTVLADGDYFLPDDLPRMVTDHRLNTLFITTSLFNLFVEEDPESFTGLRQVLTGGERASTQAFNAFLTAHPSIDLVHCYGPAEATIFTTTHQVKPADCQGPQGIPIGTPVAETGVHILDGEICVSGTGLALGYLDDPRLTAAKFTTVDIDGTATRLYRTGDLGQLDDSGVLHFLGRKDRQLKIAGHRVEPGEIETVASALPEVSGCVVLPVPDDSGRPTRLALFYLPQGRPDPKRLRRELAAGLPRYLVPDLVRPVTRFPLNPNGKVDARALLETLGSSP